VTGSAEWIGQLGAADPDPLAEGVDVACGAADPADPADPTDPAAPSCAGALTGPATTVFAANNPATPVAIAATTCARDGIGSDCAAGFRRRLTMSSDATTPDRA
jgi:hypothetical protein